MYSRRMGVDFKGPTFGLYFILVRSEMNGYMSVMYRSIMQWKSQERENKTYPLKAKQAQIIEK